MNLFRNLKLIIISLFIVFSMSDYSFSQDNFSTEEISASEEVENQSLSSRHFWDGPDEISDDYKIETYKDIGCWECVLISNFFDSVGSVFLFLYEKICFALRPILFLLFLYWLMKQYVDKGMSRKMYMSDKESVKELIKMFVKIMIAMVFLSVPSSTLFRYTLSPMINLASSLGSITLNKIDEETLLKKDDSKYMNLSLERQKARQQEVHNLIHQDILKAEQVDKNVTAETNRLIPEGAKREILYLTERFSETYSYGFKLGFKIGISGGIAFLKHELRRFLLKEIVLKRVVPKLTGPLAPIISFIVKAAVIAYDKLKVVYKFIYMKIIAFGWFILGLYFMMSFKFLFVVLNSVMEFSIAALLTPFAIITYPFKGVLDIGGFIDDIRDRFFSTSCYLFMVCIISSFIYFIFSHFLQTPYLYKGEWTTLKDIFDKMLYGDFAAQTWGSISSFMLFFWNNLDIMFIMAGIGLIGMKLIEQTANLTGTFLTPVKTEYEGQFLNYTFGTASKIFNYTKTSVQKAGKKYSKAKEKVERNESIRNVGNLMHALDVQRQIQDKTEKLKKQIDNSSKEVQVVMRDISDKVDEKNLDRDEYLLSPDEFVDVKIQGINDDKKEALSDAILNDNRVKNFSDNQSLILKSMIETGNINKSENLYSSDEEVSSDISIQNKIKEKYIEDKIAENQNRTKHELEIEYDRKKHSPDKVFEQDVNKIKNSVVKEEKEKIKQVFAEHKAKEMIQDEGFKKVLKETSLGKNASLENESWIEEKAVDIIRVARNKEGAKQYLSPDLSDEKNANLRREFKEIIELENEIRMLKSDENYNSQREFLGEDEINNKTVLKHIYKAQDAILEKAMESYQKEIDEYGLSSLPEKRQQELKQLKLLIEDTKRKQKKKNKLLEKEEYSVLEDNDIFSDESVENEEEKIVDMFKKFHMDEEYSFYKNQRKKADRKNKKEEEKTETSEEYEET